MFCIVLILEYLLNIYECFDALARLIYECIRWGVQACDSSIFVKLKIDFCGYVYDCVRVTCSAFVYLRWFDQAAPVMMQPVFIATSIVSTTVRAHEVF